MKRINILDENTANKIAAGEVVERPSSVVKELVENSIDAEAKDITIEIEEGGISLIKIIDDGIGIYEDDLEKAFMAHATSKIKSAEDIFAINTLGFRGEALPSIASIAKVYLKSKFIESDSGNEIKIEAGEVVEKSKTSCAKGTVIEVRDIFFNVPARKKFLKSTSRETALISDIVTRIAISHPEISFKLFSNGKKLLHTYGTGKLEDVLRSIYGKNTCDELLYFEEHHDIYSIYGYIGREAISRGSRNNETIFVNKRYVKDRKLAIAVENAFRAFSTVNKYPFFVLFVDTYPELIDVNIHPTKAEVKFKDDRTAFKLIFDTVHGALKEDVMGEFILPEEKTKDEEQVEELNFLVQEETLDKDALRNEFNQRMSQLNSEKPAYAQDNTEHIRVNEGRGKDYTAAKPISEGNYIIPPKPIDDHYASEVYANIQNSNGVNAIDKDSRIAQTNLQAEGSKDNSFEVQNSTYRTEANKETLQNDNEETLQKNEVPAQYTENKQTDTINTTGECTQNTGLDNAKEELSKQNPIKPQAKLPDFKVIGQYNKTYILAEWDNNLFLVDQHAAHEKVMFEKYYNNILTGEIIVQTLLIPEVIELTLDDFAIYEENKEVFTNAGFTVEEFGDNTVTIKEVPYFLGRLSSKRLLLDIIDNLRQLGSGKTVEVKYNRIATMACKSAVKANDELNNSEMEALLEKLKYLDDPFHCPHGRPTIIKFTLTDIERRFKRIV